jgi:hypothetical protein
MMRASTAAAVDVAVRSHARMFQSTSRVSCKIAKTAIANYHASEGHRPLRLASGGPYKFENVHMTR